MRPRQTTERSSEQVDGVNVDAPPNGPTLGILKDVTTQVMQCVVEMIPVSRLQEDLPAISIASALHGGWNRPQNHDVGIVRGRDRLCQALKEEAYGILTGRICPDQGLMTEGRKCQGFPLLEADGGKCLVASMDERFKNGMAWVTRLQQNLPGPMRPAGTTCDLENELGGAFGGSKVAAEKTPIHIQNANERDIGKVMSFRQHLGTDQDVRFSVVNGFEIRFELSLPSSGIAVNADQSLGWKQSGQCLLDALGSQSQKNQLITFAAWALLRDRLLEAAVVTTQ